MTTKTKVFLALVVLVIGGGLAYWKWQEAQEPIIELTAIDRTDTSIEVAFKMAYKGIEYNERIQYPAIWKRVKKGYLFEAYTNDGAIHFSIKDKDGAIQANKTVKLVK